MRFYFVQSFSGSEGTNRYKGMEIIMQSDIDSEVGDREREKNIR